MGNIQSSIKQFNKNVVTGIRKAKKFNKKYQVTRKIKTYAVNYQKAEKKGHFNQFSNFDMGLTARSPKTNSNPYATSFPATERIVYRKRIVYRTRKRKR